MKRCPECGKPMRGITVRRRIALRLRAALERLAFRIDMATAPRYDPQTEPHLHLTDEEWAEFDRPESSA